MMVLKVFDFNCIFKTLKHETSLYLMNDKFRNKYRIQSNRMPNWDYSDYGKYFITIVTKNRECNLGKIICKNGKVLFKFSPFGNIVRTEWLKSFEIRNELFLDEYIIMPNHMHAIIILNTYGSSIINDNGIKKLNDTIIGNDALETHGRASLQSNCNGRASLQSNCNDRSFLQSNCNGRASLRENDNVTQNQNPQSLIRQPKSISSFIAGFKSSVNTEIDNYIDDNQLDMPKYNRQNHFFQSNYYDHIIRNEKECYQIKNYIINNPSNWKSDSLIDNS
jgi:putative transposase